MNKEVLAYARAEKAAGRTPSFGVFGMHADFWISAPDGTLMGHILGRSFASPEAAQKAADKIVKEVMTKH